MKYQKPESNQVWRQSLYTGDVYLLPEMVEAVRLSLAVNDLLYKIFETKEIESIHKTLNEDQFFNCMKVIRKELFEGEQFIGLLKQYLRALGFLSGDVAFEPLRLRAIRPNGHLNPRAKAVYYPHRDTWYGHGQSVIVGWIPLHDLKPEQTFEVYPKWLDRPVPNNSEIFDYDQWRSGNSDKRIGWQNKNTGLTAHYPRATEEVELGERLGFGCKKAQSLFFTGAHFHRTLKQSTDRCRYSVDFRLVHLDDAKRNIGAPNTDNRSIGFSVKDYVRL
jgi:hypothetical protein